MEPHCTSTHSLSLSLSLLYCVTAIHQALFLRVAISSKKGVPRFRPSLPLPAVFSLNDAFVDYLYHKRTRSSVLAGSRGNLVTDGCFGATQLLTRSEHRTIVQQKCEDKIARWSRSCRYFRCAW